MVDPIDAIAMVDAVFFGVPVERIDADVDSELDAWRFDVDGVIKGDVSEVEVVAGYGERNSCGPAFFDMSPTVVFATGRDGWFQKQACLGGDPDLLVARLDEPVVHRGAGPPAAVRVGAVGRTDIAVLDASGRSLGAALLGVADDAAIGAAVCPGTTNVSLVTGGGQTSVTVVDIAAWKVVAEFTFRVATQPDAEIACSDHGERISVTSRENGVLRVFTAITMGESYSYEAPSFLYEAGPDYGSAVFHPAGTAILLPVGAAALRAIDARDFTVPPLGDVALPDGASVGDAAISPDGSRLAMLATLDGTPAVGRTPNTHVLVVDLVDGVPVDGSVSVVALTPESVAWPEGPALHLTWVDESTWAIEHVGNDEDWIEFVSADGTQITPPTDVGSGEGLEPVPGGVLRRHANGVQSVTVDANLVDGDPEPDDGFDRHLTVAGLRGAAEFAATDATPPAYAVTPPAAATATERPAPAPTDTAATTAAGPFAPARSSGPAPAATADDATSPIVVAVLAGAGLVVLVAIGWIVRHRRVRPAT